MMNTQDIIEALSNLEHSLLGVDSARQQVEKTVAAYGATQKQLATLSQELVKFSNELDSMVDIVRDNQEQLSATLSSKVGHLLVLIEDKVTLLGDKASVMNQTFENSCMETAKSINENVDAAIVSFKSTLQETCEKIDNHLRALSKLEDELEDIVNLQEKLNAEFLTKLETVSATIEASISDIDCQLKGIRNNNDEHHKELTEALSAILQGDNPSAKKLTARFNTVDGNIGAVKDMVSDVSTQLGTETSKIIEHNKQALRSEATAVKAENARIKNLIIFCVIVATISAILNIMMLFK